MKAIDDARTAKAKGILYMINTSFRDSCLQLAIISHIHVHHTLNFAQQLLIHSLKFYCCICKFFYIDMALLQNFLPLSPLTLDQNVAHCLLFIVDTQEDKDPGFVERLITQIIRNVQLTVEDIHIRYEDNVSMHAYTLIASYM